jgi:hypothetical protein
MIFSVLVSREEDDDASITMAIRQYMHVEMILIWNNNWLQKNKHAILFVIIATTTT